MEMPTINLKIESPQSNVGNSPPVLEREEYGEGIITLRTFSAPIASHASAATTAESMPPERPITTRVKRFLRA